MARDNSFDLIRFVAASSVLVSHQFALAGRPEPLIGWLHGSLGGAAVDVFFLLSGFLIYKSLERCARWDDFFAARIARIFPNLAFALIVTSLAYLIFYSNYANIWSHITYVSHNLAMFFLNFRWNIDGVLEGRPLPGPNGSLWTLPYEFWMYVLLFAVFLLRPVLRIPALVMLITLFSLLLIPATEPRVLWLFEMPFIGSVLGNLGLYFFCGSLVAALWRFIEGRRAVALITATVSFVSIHFMLPDSNVISSFSLAVLVIVVGSGSWANWFSKGGDASFGIYIFAFPVQQICLIVFDDFWLSLAVAAVATIGMGYATWWSFEKRCIRQRSRIAKALRFPFAVGTWRVDTISSPATA